MGVSELRGRVLYERVRHGDTHTVIARASQTLDNFSIQPSVFSSLHTKVPNVLMGLWSSHLNSQPYLLERAQEDLPTEVLAAAVFLS